MIQTNKENDLTEEQAYGIARIAHKEIKCAVDKLEKSFGRTIICGWNESVWVDDYFFTQEDFVGEA